MYDRLFSKEDPEEDTQDFTENINPESIVVLDSCRVEKSLVNATPEKLLQFERLGYFCVDSKESKPESLVFNRTVTLRDAWAKVKKAKPQQKQKQQKNQTKKK